MKRDFRGLCSDQWDRKQAGDPSVDHDLARKVHPWGSYASRDGPDALIMDKGCSVVFAKNIILD